MGKVKVESHIDPAASALNALLGLGYLVSGISRFDMYSNIVKCEVYLMHPQGRDAQLEGYQELFELAMRHR